jgi:hypothetical protein
MRNSIKPFVRLPGLKTNVSKLGSLGDSGLARSAERRISLCWLSDEERARLLHNANSTK